MLPADTSVFSLTSGNRELLHIEKPRLLCVVAALPWQEVANSSSYPSKHTQLFLNFKFRLRGYVLLT